MPWNAGVGPGDRGAAPRSSSGDGKIPCADFIPAYSELFTFLEAKGGRPETG
jgi:hypothetical protein